MTSEFKKMLSNLLKARFPYIYIPTWEEERVINVINEVADTEELIKTKRRVFTWRITSGISEDSITNDKQTQSALGALDFIENYDEPSIFILLDFHVHLDPKNNSRAQIIRKLRDLVNNLKHSPKNVIFISPELSVVLPEDLQKDITILDFDLPSVNEINNALEDLKKANEQGGRIIIDITPEEQEILVKAAVGLTLKEAENAFARAMVDDGKLDISDLEIILDEKSQIIKKTGVLEFIVSDVDTADVGGLENLKKWLMKRDKSWLGSAQKYCLPSPKGVLITGVPGCGKSLLAKSISSRWKLPLLKLDVSRIFSGIVGSSEENMRNSIKMAEAISPAILWIDEIEKGFGGVGSSGDSGTSTRVFGTFLTWMQEKTKPVFVVATANNIDYMPAEFLRKGRFDEIFFVDLPTFSERTEIFKVHLQKRLVDPEVKGDFKIDDTTLKKLSEITEGFGGAEIEQIVISGLFEAFSEDRSLKFEDLENSIKNTVPLSVTQDAQIRKIREWANVRAVAATPTEHLSKYGRKSNDNPPKSKDETPKTDDISTTRGGRTLDF